MKFKSRYREGAAVYSLDDELIGYIDRLVIDSTTREVTHLIVRQDSQAAEARVIPTGWVGSIRERDITLYCRAAQLENPNSQIRTG